MMQSKHRQILILSLFFLTVPLSSCFFIESSPRHHITHTYHHHPYARKVLCLFALSQDDDTTSSSSLPPAEKINEPAKKKGYQFGDISKSIAKKFTSSVNELTQKETYQFGDLSRYLDSRIKNKVNEMSGNDRYQFGDLTKQILKKVASREYKLDEIVMLCKALLSFGVGLSSVGGFLPVKVLLEMLNYSIMADVGGKLVEALTIEIDKKVKEAVTGDADYKLGDYTKKAITEYTGKEEYEFGDITRIVMTEMEKSGGTRGGGGSSATKINDKMMTELETIDETTKGSQTSKTTDS